MMSLSSCSTMWQMRVQVLSGPDFPPARYVVSVFSSLGYRASLRIAGDRFNALSNNSQYQVQISRGGRAANYPAPSEFIPFLSCRAFRSASDANRNVAQFCDPDIDRDIGPALRLQATDPQAASRLWTSLDDRIATRRHGSNR
jgi:peptide/nickel transport system substrate-binding protein